MALTRSILRAKCACLTKTVLKSMDNVTKALELFEKLRQDNPYLYFELAYTRTTDWMCWLIDKTGGGKAVLCESQADNPDEAALNVRLTLEVMCKEA